MCVRNWPIVSRAIVGVLAIPLLFLTMLAGASLAQSSNHRTTVTFTVPVEIPGVGAQILPAGVYVFRLLDSQADRNVVQILNENESHVFATILAIPNHRLKATSDTVVTFAERAAGEPRAIRAWFYPGETWGQEFVYPKTKAAQLAKIAEAPVLYIPDEVAPNIVVPAVTATEPEVVALKEAPLRAVTPSGEDIAIAEALAPPAAPIPAVVAAEPRVIALPPPEAEAIVPRISAASATPEPEPRFIDRTEDPSAIEGARSSPVLTARLPATASNLPMLALIGLLCIGLGVSLRALCAR